MTDSPHNSLEETAAEKTTPESPDTEVTSPDEVDPDNGTDADDKPVDNPAG